ncbi:MAG TPA: hypothetical protein VFF98_12420 [Novosphingobium sp.]|nr:hypothetical protein [Novosphingobium sp.]
MIDIVGGISMSHVPGALGWPDAPPADQQARLAAIHTHLRERLAAARPDLIVAFLDDHFENHFRNLLPTLGVGIAPAHIGPAAYMMEALRFDRQHAIPSDADLAEGLLRELVHAGFDAARMGAIEYGNNLMMPLHYIRPEFDIPVLPVFINVFSPPLMPYGRAYDLGLATRRALEAIGGDRRILFLATGGLSHWPPVWTEGAPEDDSFLQRMKTYQTEGKGVIADDPDLYTDLARYEMKMMDKMQWPLGYQHPLVNAEFDEELLARFAEGDVRYMREITYDEVEQRGGHGGHELLNWVALMGAMNGARADYTAYEPVTEWITGMAYAAYDGQQG